MRHHKYRAYDTKLKKFVEVVDNVILTQAGALVPKTGIILQQSLNICYDDESEQEIFEGDVVHEGNGQKWIVEYGAYGDPVYYVYNLLNSNRRIDELEMYASGWGFSIDGTDTVPLKFLGTVFDFPDIQSWYY